MRLHVPSMRAATRHLHLVSLITVIGSSIVVAFQGVLRPGVGLGHVGGARANQLGCSPWTRVCCANSRQIAEDQNSSRSLVDSKGPDVLHPAVSKARIKTGRAREWANRAPAGRLRWTQSTSFISQARMAVVETNVTHQPSHPQEHDAVAAKKSTKRDELSALLYRKGRLKDAFKAVEEIIEEGDKLTAKTFGQLMVLCVEQTRRGYARLVDGYAVLDLCRKAEVEPDTVMYNSLMTCAAKAAGRGHATLADGSKIIQEMKTHGIPRCVVTYNSLLDVCAKAAGSQGGIPVTPMTGYSVLRLLEDEGLAPTVVTFSTLMLLCARAASVGRATPKDGAVVLERMAASGVQGNARLFNIYMDLVAKAAEMGKAGVEEGHAVLEAQRQSGVQPTVVTFNSLLDVCARAAGNARGTLHEGYQVISKMKKVGVAPDTISYNTLMDVCAKQAAVGNAGVEEGLLILEAMREDDVPRDVLTYSILLDVCAKATEQKSASIEDADSILDRMREEHLTHIDTVLCNSFLECAKADGSAAALLSAQELFNRMEPGQRDTYSYTRMISLLGKRRNWQGALRVLEEARQDGKRPTAFMYNAAMQACLHAGRVDDMRIVHQSMRADGVRSDAVTREILSKSRGKAKSRRR